MIRKLQKADTERVMEIWLNGNADAHPFIPKDYILLQRRVFNTVGRG